LVRISSTTATFSGLAICLPLAGTDRDVTADTRDVPFSEGASSGGGWFPITSKETGGLWLDEVMGGTRGLYYEAVAARSSACAIVGSPFTPGPIVELAVTALT